MTELAPKLEELGFTKEEAKVYLALLELGSAYVSTIAKKANIHRVSCYHTLDKLVRRGVVSTFERNNVKTFSIENPQIIVNQIEEQFDRAKGLLPELLSITNSLAYKPKIQYYEGLKGIKNIFEDTLRAEGEILGYTNLAELPRVIPQDYLNHYADKKNEKKIKTRMLSPLSKDALSYKDRYYPKDFDPNLVEILFINPKEFLFEYEINIYGDRVSLISLNPEEMIGLTIESSVYAKTQRAIFNLAWLGATSFVAR